MIPCNLTLYDSIMSFSFCQSQFNGIEGFKMNPPQSNVVLSQLRSYINSHLLCNSVERHTFDKL